MDGRAVSQAWLAFLLCGCTTLEHTQEALAASAGEQFQAAPAQNPWAAANAFATQHGDTAASDTSPLPGPGRDIAALTSLNLLAACPSILPRTDGLLMAVCTKLLNQTPTVFLIDPTSLIELAQRELGKGELFGGVYPYLDPRDRLITVDGAQDLLQIAARRSEGGWTLEVEQTLSLDVVRERCGAAHCDSVVGLAPDHDGRVWFATAHGLVGNVGTNGAIATVALEGELIANSIATAPQGVAVVTERAFYLFSSDAEGAPQIRMRAEYDRGAARKPGQLSWGSGSTPTFFGPETGSEYVAILDNAQPTMNLLVYRTDGSSEPVCRHALPAPAGLGSENSPIGIGRSVFIASTYGFSYPALPPYAGASVPPAAPLLGGIVRVDVARDERGCITAWSKHVSSLAVPKLSLADGLIYTVASVAQGRAFVALDAADGSLVSGVDVPRELADTMQLAGTIGMGRSFYQGTMLGLFRVAPAVP